jgi:hypothetical protein
MGRGLGIGYTGRHAQSVVLCQCHDCVARRGDVAGRMELILRVAAEKGVGVAAEASTKETHAQFARRMAKVSRGRRREWQEHQFHFGTRVAR